MRLLLGHTIGLSTTSYLRSQELDRRHESSQGEQHRLSERMDEFERRLVKIEEKIES